MANPEHVKIVKQGAEAIDEWREKHPDESFDLREADLREAKLKGAVLIGADLSETDLCDAILIGANLSNACLFRANLSDAYMRGANLCEADLSEADLIGTVLFGAELRKAYLSMTYLNLANLDDCNFEDARSWWTIWANVDLSKAKGLESINHTGPSTVGIDTFYKSQGKIPDVFLRGCGVPQWMIATSKLFNQQLTAREIEDILSVDVFPGRTEGHQFLGGVFISYSHEDSKFADKIYDKLWEAGASVWRDVHDATSGPLDEQVWKQIDRSDVVLVVLSENSIESDWVEAEIKRARQREKELKTNILCPVALDESWKSKTKDDVLWSQLEKKNVLDFSSWNSTKFDNQFRKLIDGMKIFYPPEEKRKNGP